MSDKINQEEEVPFINPIDKDKITENPSTLPYAHTVGGAVIKPIDKGRIKGLAMTAMKEQTTIQLDQIYDQVQLLVSQAKKVKERVQISEMIYQADIGFKPLIGHKYHLYEKTDQQQILSMIGPNEWGKSFPYVSFLASVELLADHTWKISESNMDSFDI